MTTWAVTLHDKVIKQFDINEDSRLIIGRSKDADVVIDNTAISREHTALECRDGVYYLSDLKSLNGTFVNGKRIEASVPIAMTDAIHIGKFQLVPVGEETALHSPSVSSSSASPFDMDMDDATVFVSSKTRAAMDRRVKDKPKHLLRVFDGPSNLSELSLDGKTSIKIGKDPGCDLVIPGFLVGRAQCYIIQKEKKYVIIPQKSWAKTSLNGMPIKDEKVLLKGDIIQIRKTKIKFD